MMLTNFFDVRRIIICSVYIGLVKGYIYLNVLSDTDKCPGSAINISCIVDPQTTEVRILKPGGPSVVSCTAPLGGTATACTPIVPYRIAVNKVGTTTAFVLTIPSLNKSIHNGIWECGQGFNDRSQAMLSVTPTLTSLGKSPTIAVFPASGGLVSNASISGHVYCQKSKLTSELLYANQNGVYARLELQPPWSELDVGNNRCDPGENNRTYTTTVTRTMSALKGKTVTFKIQFNQTDCASSFTTDSSPVFFFPEPPNTDRTIINAVGSSLSLAEGENVSLQCEVIGGVPLAEITWNCFGGTVTNTSIDGIAKSNITFTTNRLHNGQLCTCSATHPVADIMDTSVQIYVTYLAKIISMVISGNNFTVREHSTPSITCNAEGSPLPLITLRYVKNNTVIAKTTGLRLQYTLPYARCEDTGKYRCEAVNNINQLNHMTNELYVLCSPRRIDTEHMKLVYGIGETLNLTAVYLAYPTPVFKWFFQQNNMSDSTELTDGMDNVHINNVMEFKSDIFLHLTQIIRKSLQIKDFGKYTITAENYINISYDNLTIINDGRPISSRDVNVVCLDQQRAILTWISEFNNGAKQRFYIQYRSGKSEFNTTAIEDPGQWKFITEEITGLKESSLYIFTVVATNRFGSTYSKNVKCTTHGENQQLHEEGFIGGIYFAGFFSALAIAIVVLIVYRKRRCISKPKGIESSKTQNDSKYEDLQTRQEPNAYEMPEHTVQYGSANNSEQSQYEPVQAGTSISAYEEIKNNRGIDTCSRSNEYDNNTATIL